MTCPDPDGAQCNSLNYIRGRKKHGLLNYEVLKSSPTTPRNVKKDPPRIKRKRRKEKREEDKEEEVSGRWTRWEEGRKKKGKRNGGRIVVAEPHTQSSQGTDALPGPSGKTWLNAGSCLLNTNLRIKISVSH